MLSLSTLLQSTCAFEDVSDFLNVGDLQIFSLCSTSCHRAVFQPGARWQRDGIDFNIFPFWLTLQPSKRRDYVGFVRWMELRSSGHSFGDQQVLAWVGRMANMRSLYVGYSVELTDKVFQQFYSLAMRPIQDNGSNEATHMAQTTVALHASKNDAKDKIAGATKESGLLEKSEREIVSLSASELRKRGDDFMDSVWNRFENLRTLSVGCSEIREMPNITNDGLMEFVTILPNLESLSLRGLTNVTVDLLATSGQSCPKLKFVDVTGCSSIIWQEETLTEQFLAKCVYLETLILTNTGINLLPERLRILLSSAHPLLACIYGSFDLQMQPLDYRNVRQEFSQVEVGISCRN